MDFITAGGILVCIGMLWIFSVLMLRLLYQLQKRVEALEYPQSDMLRLLYQLQKRVEALEYPQSEQRCQHCRWQKDCLAYDTGVCYPCKHFLEGCNDNGTNDIAGTYGNNTCNN